MIVVKLPHAHFDPWHEHAMRITVVILLTTQTTTYTLLNKIVRDFDKETESWYTMLVYLCG